MTTAGAGRAAGPPVAAAGIFFAVALINPRDFPVPNIPLIYPAFLLLGVQLGLRSLLVGLRRVATLVVILVGYQLYLTGLRAWLGGPVSLGDYAYVLEPPMILVGAAAVAVRAGGARAGSLALVSVVAVSAAWGVGIYLVGEPFTTVRDTLQYSIGGVVGSGTVLREIDMADDLTDLMGTNAGLSSDIVIFGYQLAAALVIVICAMLAGRRATGVRFSTLALLLTALIGGVVTNTERATAAAVAIGTGTFLLTGRVRWPVFRRALALLLVAGAALFVVTTVTAGSVADGERQSLFDRAIADDYTRVRMYMAIPALMSIADVPLGTGTLSQRYIDTAFNLGWLTTKNGYPEAHSPHNHYAAMIMFGGLVAVTAIAVLLRGLWRRLRLVCEAGADVHVRGLAAACVGSLVHALFHNAGFFGLVPPTLMVFGLLWASTAPPWARHAARRGHDAPAVPPCAQLTGQEASAG